MLTHKPASLASPDECKLRLVGKFSVSFLGIFQEGVTDRHRAKCLDAIG